MSYYIYGFRLRGDPECRYIGMTSRQPEDRLHARRGEAERRVRWGNPDEIHTWLVTHGERVESFKIGKVETRAEALAMERAMVALVLRLGHRLFNFWLVPTTRRIGWTPYKVARPRIAANA